MFATYKKIISPESSPVLGPVYPNLAPTNAIVNVNNANVNVNNAMEPFSLYTCCCSNRTNKDSTIIMENDIKEKEKEKEKEETMMVKTKYEFGHATHYTYGVTSPRLLCEFDTGTPSSP